MNETERRRENKLAFKEYDITSGVKRSVEDILEATPMIKKIKFDQISGLIKCRLQRRLAEYESAAVGKACSKAEDAMYKPRKI